MKLQNTKCETILKAFKKCKCPKKDQDSISLPSH